MRNCSFRELIMNAVVEGVGGWTATSVGGSPGRLVPNGVPRDPTLQLSTFQLPLTLQLSTLQLPLTLQLSTLKLILTLQLSISQHSTLQPMTWHNNAKTHKGGVAIKIKVNIIANISVSPTESILCRLVDFTTKVHIFPNSFIWPTVKSKDSLGMVRTPSPPGYDSIFTSIFPANLIEL